MKVLLSLLFLFSVVGCSEHTGEGSLNGAQNSPTEQELKVSKGTSSSYNEVDVFDHVLAKKTGTPGDGPNRLQVFETFYQKINPFHIVCLHSLRSNR